MDYNFGGERLTLTGQSYNNKITVEISADCDIHEFLDACKTIAIGLTYHEKSWEMGIQQKAEDYSIWNKD